MDSQFHVRSFLETCTGHYKVIFCCYDIFKLKHLRSLCIGIQLRRPSDMEVMLISNWYFLRSLFFNVWHCCPDSFPILSGFVIVHSVLQIVETLNFIAKQEDIELPYQLAKKIAEKSKHCLQQAIRSFEATWQSG